MPDSGERLSACTAHHLLDRIRARGVTARDLTQAALDRIREIDSDICAFLTVDEAGALQQADSVDSRLAAGDPVGPLAGIPVGLKDVISTRGIPTTCGSRILEGYIPPYDATVVTRLKEADAVLIGKLNMDEFAMGSSNENSAYGPVRNPRDRTRVPGGSSGGAAAAVAADETVLSLGSDTGGSIRLPASYCGVVGLKPTYGRVSRYGLVAYASSLDQIGPFGRDVRDVAHLLKTIAGHDPCDSTSADIPVPDYVASLEEGVSGLRIGLPGQFFAEGLDAGVRASVEDAVARLERAGATLCEVDLPVAGHSDYSVASYYVIATAEASSNLARYDGVKYGLRVNADDLNEMYARTRSAGFGEEVKRRIMLGTYVLSAGYYDAYYLKAQRVRTLIRRDFERAFQACDLIAGPVSATPAFPLGERVDDPLQMYLTDIYTVSVNLAGIPGISVPCTKSPEGLPVGLQLLAPAFEEQRLLRAARALEKDLAS